MNTLDKKYTDLLQDILDNGVKKEDRTGTGTLSVFGRQIRHKMSEGFPLITTKKMYFKGIVTELLWFLRGDTNIKYLVDNDCHIWDGDAYKKFKNQFDWLGETNHLRPNEFFNDSNEILTKEEFINKIKTDADFAEKWGDLGPVYGAQWRGWKGISTSEKEFFYARYNIDQIANLINDLKTNPDSRRLMVSAWNVGELDQMTLPPCHYGFQVYTRELSLEERLELAFKSIENTHGNSAALIWQLSCQGKKKKEILEALKNSPRNIPTRAISLQWSQRSVDTFLGLPFNIASYGLLLEIIAKEVNMVPDELIGNLGDTHLYLNHIEQAKEQIGEIIYEDSVTIHSPFHKDGIQKKIPIGSTREPYPLPTLKLSDWYSTQGDMSINAFVVDISSIESCHIYLENYQSHPTIKAPLSN
jgi:thymidylate synthase